MWLTRAVDAQVMRQGVMCKEWQRTPMTVLREYCQSKKRKQAYYTNVKAPEGQFRCVRTLLVIAGYMSCMHED